MSIIDCLKALVFSMLSLAPEGPFPAMRARKVAVGENRRVITLEKLFSWTFLAEHSSYFLGTECHEDSGRYVVKSSSKAHHPTGIQLLLDSLTTLLVKGASFLGLDLGEILAAALLAADVTS